MARIARVVVPNTPHHVTQRGNRRQPVFFCEDDYAAYFDRIVTCIRKVATRVLAYCLMPNHVHFVMVPPDVDGLRGTLSEAHRRYTRYVNLREGWRGHLWQERFHSFPMDETHLWMAMRYIEMNPVKAGLADAPAAWRWSSAAAHLHGTADPLIDVATAPASVSDWARYLGVEHSVDENKLLERHLRTGRPLGGERFIAMAEHELGRSLRKQRPGRKPSILE